MVGKLGARGGFGSLGSVGGRATPTPGFVNFTGTNLPTWNAALTARAAGTRNAVLCLDGDSTVAGFGANGNGWVGARPQSSAAQLAGLLANSSWQSLTGTNNSPDASFNGFDARVSRTGWIPDLAAGNSGTSCGGPMWISATAADVFTFTPLTAWDTAIVLYAKLPSAGTITADVGGSTLATANQNAANGVGSMTVSTGTAAAIQPLNLKNSVGGNVFFSQIVCYNSAVKEISILNSGSASFKSSQLALNAVPWNPGAIIPSVAADLRIEQGGVINDWCSAISVVTSMANLQTLITKQQLVGDMILMSSAPSLPGTSGAPDYATQQTYVDAMYTLAVTNNIPFIDIWRLFGGIWTTDLYYDGLHPNAAGAGLMAAYFKVALNPSFKTGAAPDIIPPLITSSGTQTVVEGNAFSLTLTANETVTWSKIGGADTALFTLTGSTLSMTSKVFASPTDADANNTYIVQVKATDLAGNATSQTVTVSVTAIFDPSTLSPVFWYEARNGGMFQSNAGTTAAVADGDVVGYLPDKSGGGLTMLSAANDTTRPTLQGTATKPYLSFDGTNDTLRVLSDPGSFAAGATSWFVVLQSNSSGAGKVILGVGRSSSITPAFLFIESNATTASTASAFLRNDSNSLYISSTTAIQTGVFDGTAHVYGAIDNGSGITPYLDGVAGTRVTHSGWAGVTTLDRFSMGSFISTTTSAWWAGRIYAAIGVNRVLNSTEIANLNSYLAALK